MQLNEKLVSLRKEKGLTQLKVAEELDISRQAISRWESGVAMPSTENLRCLIVLLVTYVLMLPKFTYQEAVYALQEAYEQVQFSANINKKNQMLAPHVEQGNVRYYCYIVEGNGENYYFDQYTGEYGRVTTNPNNE